MRMHSTWLRCQSRRLRRTASGPQMPVSWQPITTLYCVRTFYEPTDSSDLTVRPPLVSSIAGGRAYHEHLFFT